MKEMNAIYARQSLDKKDSLSIEGQIELCAVSAQPEYIIYQDRGFSGKNTQRPAFQQLMRDVVAGKIQKIFVYRLDRFSRSIADFGQVWKQLEAHGVQFESVTEKFDTSSPMGRAMLNIIMVFAQLERETTAERVRDNYYHRFQLGAWPGGPAPFGFRLGKLTDPEGRRVSTLLQEETQSKIVCQIFQRYVQPEQSLGSVARWLTDQGIPDIKRKAWDNVAVSRILHNPLYVRADEDVFWHYAAKGIQSVHPVEAFQGSWACNLIGKRDRSRGKYTAPGEQRLALANHVGIVPSDLWLACQRKLAQNQQISRLSVGKHSWLSGLLKCGKCGYSVKINLCDNKFYLACAGRSNLKVCDARISIDLRELEQVVEQEICKLLEQCPPEPLSDPDSKMLTEQIVVIDEKIDRLVQAVAAGTSLTAQYLEREISRLDGEKQKLLAEQARASTNTQISRIEFHKLNFDEKKIIVRNFIHAVLLRDDQVKILWKF